MVIDGQKSCIDRGTIMWTLSNKGGRRGSEEQTNTSSDVFVTELLLMTTPAIYDIIYT